MLHLEHVTYTPAPPGPKGEGTEPSVHTWISEGRREDSLFEADRSRAVLLPVQSGMKGGNGEVGCSPWGKGGHMIRKENTGKGGGTAPASCHLIVVVQSPPQWGWVEMAGQISRGARPKARPHCQLSFFLVSLSCATRA